MLTPVTHMHCLALQHPHLLNSSWDGDCRAHAHDGGVHTHSSKAPEDAQHWQAPSKSLAPGHEQHCSSTVRDLYWQQHRCAGNNTVLAADPIQTTTLVQSRRMQLAMLHDCSTQLPGCCFLLLWSHPA